MTAQRCIALSLDRRFGAIGGRPTLARVEIEVTRGKTTATTRPHGPVGAWSPL